MSCAPAATSHAAGSVDRDGLQDFPIGRIGKAHPQRALLAHALTTAAVRIGQDREENAADGPIAGENLTLCRRIRKQTLPPRFGSPRLDSEALCDPLDR
jgi:hypothetical protein